MLLASYSFILIHSSATIACYMHACLASYFWCVLCPVPLFLYFFPPNTHAGKTDAVVDQVCLGNFHMLWDCGVAIIVGIHMLGWGPDKRPCKP